MPDSRTYYWSTAMTQALIPPFNLETATLKVQRAEDLWNSRDPKRVSMAYTENSQWRNRSEFVQGRVEIAELLTRKWQRELDYRLKKELFSYRGNRIAVQFEYEYHDDTGQWFRAYGIEHWNFDSEGLMQVRNASINELAIEESDRQLLTFS
jgi:nuclear transport factor 2 (NTF2) superfamily protein